MIRIDYESANGSGVCDEHTTYARVVQGVLDLTATEFVGTVTFMALLPGSVKDKPIDKPDSDRSLLLIMGLKTSTVVIDKLIVPEPMCKTLKALELYAVIWQNAHLQDLQVLSTFECKSSQVTLVSWNRSLRTIVMRDSFVDVVEHPSGFMPRFHKLVLVEGHLVQENPKAFYRLLEHQHSTIEELVLCISVKTAHYLPNVTYPGVTMLEMGLTGEAEPFVQTLARCPQIKHLTLYNEHLFHVPSVTPETREKVLSMVKSLEFLTSFTVSSTTDPYKLEARTWTKSIHEKGAITDLPCEWPVYLHMIFEALQHHLSLKLIGNVSIPPPIKGDEPKTKRIKESPSPPAEAAAAAVAPPADPAVKQEKE